MASWHSLLLLAAIGCASGTSSGAAVNASPAPAAIPPVAGEMKEARGVRYVDVVAGMGEPVAAGRCVFVHYTGWLADGTRFESSRDSVRNMPVRPFAFVQGAHGVIDGWEIGIEGMSTGGVRRLYVPHRLAYGDAGHKPRIPGRTNLVFDLEVMAVTGSLRGARDAGACPPWSDVGR